MEKDLEDEKDLFRGRKKTFQMGKPPQQRPWSGSCFILGHTEGKGHLRIEKRMWRQKQIIKVVKARE